MASLCDAGRESDSDREESQSQKRKVRYQTEVVL